MHRRRRHHGLGALLAAPLLGGCTFLALDEFNPPRCTTNDQCDVLNQQAGIPAGACERYQCARQERTCRLQRRDDDGDGDPSTQCGGSDCDDDNPRRVGNPALARALCSGTEDCCDGVDNNCNDVIDEGQWRARAPQSLGPALERVAEVTVAPRANAPPAVLHAAEGRAAFGVVRGAAATFSPLQYERQRLTIDRMMIVADRGQCPQLEATGNVGSAMCTFGDVVAAQADAALGRWFVASVNRTGCTAGQLRLGHFDESDGAVVLSDGFSNIAAGVDVSTAQVCTGASRMPALLGASRPALAALVGEGGRPPEALAAWLARPLSGAGCGVNANVEALGLWLDRHEVAGTARFAVRGTDDGRRKVLGVTQGSARPAVVAAPTASPGFLVGYGVEAGGVALHFVPAFDLPGAALDTTGASLAVRGGQGPGDHTALAISPLRAGNVDVGVAWREGCGETGGVWFAQVRLGGSRLQALSAPVRLTQSAVGAPAVAYAGSGFVRAGFTRGGMTATEASDGGWVVSWLEGAGGAQRVLGRRMLELDGQPLTEEPLVLAEGLGGLVSQGVHAGAAAASAQLTYVVYAAAGGALSSGDLLCRAAMP